MTPSRGVRLGGGSRQRRHRRRDPVVVRVACVVLAAGTSERFSGNKLLYPLEGETLLGRALRACSAFPTVAVCSASVASFAQRDGVEVVVHSHPEYGMAYSLQRASERIDRSWSIAVLPADLRYIEPEHVALVVAAAAAADVTFPMRDDGTPGHPVVFSPRVREEIAALPRGSPIRSLRDRKDFSRLILPIPQSWPYHDVDRESDLAER